MSRDSQRAKVYAWERIAFQDLFSLKNHQLTPSETKRLINRVHDDVRAAGGHSPTVPIIKFTRRSGGACASWFQLNFTPGNISLAIALHEIAHSLTWCPPVRVSAEMAAKWKARELTEFEQHTLDYCDDQGHGAKYVACYIALMERYAGHAVAAAVQTARGFAHEAWGKWQLVGPSTSPDGRRFYIQHRQRDRVTKHDSVRIDAKALAYWRTLLEVA